MAGGREVRREQLVLPTSRTRNNELLGPLTGLSPQSEITAVSWGSSSCGPSFLGSKGVSSLLSETQKQTLQDILAILRLLSSSTARARLQSFALIFSPTGYMSLGLDSLTGDGDGGEIAPTGQRLALWQVIKVLSYYNGLWPYKGAQYISSSTVYLWY